MSANVPSPQYHRLFNNNKKPGAKQGRDSSKLLIEGILETPKSI